MKPSTQPHIIAFSKVILTLKSVFLFSFISIFTLGTSAQIADNANVFIEYLDTEKEVNVNGRDAIGMFESYIEGYSDLNVVTSKDKSDFTFVLSIYEKNFGNRRGKLDLYNSTNDELIFESGLVKGMPLIFYGYSGSRHVIARAFIDHFLEEYPHINKK